MNVTSLLNTSGAAQAVGERFTSDPAAIGGQQMGERIVPVKTSNESRQHSQSRTPWDAGGYSLPLTLNVKDTQDSIASRPTFFPEPPPVDGTGSISPKSPNHKFSDSHSSLSSYTTVSSNNSSGSQSHSRISSLSTMSEYQALSMFVSDTIPTERRMSDTDSGTSCPTVVETQPLSPSSRRPIDGVPFGNDNSRLLEQLQSPSGAISVRNGVRNGTASPIDSINIDSFLGADSPTISTFTSSTSKVHMRTVSAPDFSSPNTKASRSRHFPTFGPMAEPTPPKSPQGDDVQSVDSDSDSPVPALERSQVVGVSAQSTAPPQPACLFFKRCTTGSQLRKVVSHLFGRNKLCTKAIPNHIWVHLCRKHYQRTRYRDAVGYAKRQAELVVEQIRRVQAWSDGNVSANRRGDGYLQNWTLQARKREAMRLQERAASRKRPRTADEDEEEETATALSPGTAIPEWLENKLNQQYDTAGMLEIIQELRDRMNNNEIEQIPDIEILPNIITNNSKTTTKPKAKTQRGHRHSKSDVYGTPHMSRFHESKRARIGPSPYAIHVQNLTHSNQAYQGHLNNGFASNAATQTSPNNFWNSSPYGNNIVLPAPVPQRHISPSVNGVQQSPTAHGRSVHARSISENPMMYGSGNGYRSYASQSGQGYQHQDIFSNYTVPTGYSLPTTYQGYSTNANNTNTSTSTNTESGDPQTHFFGSLNSSPPNSEPPRVSHARLQSTQSFQQLPMRPSPVSSGPSSLNSLPSMTNNMSHGAMSSYYNNQNMGASNSRDVAQPMHSYFGNQNVSTSVARQSTRAVSSNFGDQVIGPPVSRERGRHMPNYLARSSPSLPSVIQENDPEDPPHSDSQHHVAIIKGGGYVDYSQQPGSRY